MDNETRLAHILRDIAGLEYREIALILEKILDPEVGRYASGPVADD